MKEIKLSDIEVQVLELVVNRFVSEKKETSRHEILLFCDDPDVLDLLVRRSLLRDVNGQAVLPGLLTFHYCGNVASLRLAKESVETVLYALRSLFKEIPQNTQVTPAQIAAKASELGRKVYPDTVWLGLYLIQNNFSALGSFSGYAEKGEIVWLTIGEQVLKIKQIDKAWDAHVALQIEWQLQRESYNPSSGLQELYLDPESFNGSPAFVDLKQNQLKVFISHSSKDAEIAVRLIDLVKAALALRDDQIRCTSVDEYRLTTGANTDEVLKSEVRQAAAFIGLITPHSVKSAYVLFELGARWGAGLHMMPVLAGVGPGTLAGPLKGINSVSGGNETHLHKLIEDLAAVLQLPVQSASSYSRYVGKLIEEINRQYGITANPVIPEKPDTLSGLPSSRKIDNLTRELVIAVARQFVWSKQLPKWTVIVEGRELPVRPLVLQAAGALPNDSTTSNAATSKLKMLGFEIRYQGRKA